MSRTALRPIPGPSVARVTLADGTATITGLAVAAAAPAELPSARPHTD